LDASKRRLLQGLLVRSNRVVRKLNSPATHVAAGGKPRCFEATFGPISLITSRRAGAAGFEFNAPLATPGAYLTPLSPVLVGQYGPWIWCGTNAELDLSWTWLTQRPVRSPTNPTPAGNLFSPAIENNGGAMILNNFSAPNKARLADLRNPPYLSCDVDIYDKTRQRSITGGRIGIETFMGGNYGPKDAPVDTTFPMGTEFEPRLYVNEMRAVAATDDDAYYAASSVAAWVTIWFEGLTLSQPPVRP
jgi:hypothetical protein